LTVYHIQNPAPCTLEQAARAVVPWLEILPDDIFDERFERALSGDSSALFAPLLDFRQRMQTAPVTISVSNTHTMEQLKAAGFQRELPGPERTLRAFRFSDAERLGRKGNSHGI
ncbi:MAG: hypothetical protein SOY37_09150, partial [Oscillospiraceae bacterium]|nr:hypothetical protein [Oscillospiraceae bacterium]